MKTASYWEPIAKSPPPQAPMAGATEFAMLRMNLTPYWPPTVVLAFLADSAAAAPKSCGEAAKIVVARSRSVIDVIRGGHIELTTYA
jgi:hypothetical protein